MLKILKHNLVILFFISLFTCGCKKLLTIDAPFTSVNADNVYSNDVTAAAVLTGVYAQMSFYNRNAFISRGVLSNVSILTSLSSDELTLYDQSNSDLSGFYLYSLNGNLAPTYWDNIYPNIFTVNAAISALADNSILTPSVQRQLLGESKFIRAFCYFYLVNLYGKVPLVTTTDPYVSSIQAATSLDSIYAQIIDDLKNAESLLSKDYLASNVQTTVTDRVRPTKWAAAALLARVYLYRGNYLEAQKQCDLVIDSTSLFHLDSLNGAFLSDTKEAIWQLQCVTSDQGNTGDGQYFVLYDSGPDVLGSHPVYLSSSFVNSFEPNDMRRAAWVDSSVTSSDVYYYPFKYKSGMLNPNGETSEYEMVIRLGEIYLIRAEVRAQLANLEGARADLNLIRSRAGLGNILIDSKDGLLNAIMQERKMELFTEWGNRWFDLKRTGKINQVMADVAIEKGTSWKSDFQLYPLTNDNLIANPKLVQNPGY